MTTPLSRIAITIASALVLAACATSPSPNWQLNVQPGGPGEAQACRAELAGNEGTPGRNAAYEACMARHRRPERDD